MGTPCATIFLDEDNDPCVKMLRHYDGYLSCHGKELATFLLGITMVDGIPCHKKTRKTFRYANGIECLAAQVIAYFKKGAGDIYISSNGWDDEDFQYYVSGKIGEEPTIKIKYRNNIRIQGYPKEILEYIRNHENE